ncbi:SCO6745 family protein [Kitasatospora sp. NBC_01539]|uniref:SCO6745 family protein n=1 Tax=Kitasatospora sp. NBC_01539 TaxID=2903577 RepID=UPI0038601A9D
MELLAGRKCHDALNPLHSLIYFAPEAEEEFTAAGLDQGRMCYFAGRSAAMGAVGAGPVAAAFFNFSPALVARHIPRAWTLASPDAVLEARQRAVDRTLRRLLGDGIAADPEVAEAATLALRAVEACAPAGRTLYAAHAGLPTPDEPHLALWHAVTLLREYRGDGHLAALTEAELDGPQALVTHTATGRGFTTAFARASRGWTDTEWAQAADRLAGRGLLDTTGALTEAGHTLRRGIEDTTDRLAHPPFAHLGQAGVERLTAIGRGLTATATSNGAFPRGIFSRT